MSLIPALIKGWKILNRIVKKTWHEETHQLFIAESSGSHGGRDSSLTRVLHERLETRQQTEQVFVEM